MGSSVKRVNVPPCALRGQQLKEIAWQVFQYQYFDGITVCAQKSDIPFYGTALTLMLKNFRRPVVFFAHEEQAAEAERWASLGVAGIFALGDDGLDLACRTTVDEKGRLCSPFYPPVGRHEGGFYEIFRRLLPMDEPDPFLMCDAMNDSIILSYPGEDMAERQGLMEASGVLMALQTEEDAEWLFSTQMPVLQKLHRRRIPVLVTGLKARPDDPKRRRMLLLSGVTPAGDMTREAAAVKLMWTLARTGSAEGVKLYFGLSFGGEVTQG